LAERSRKCISGHMLHYTCIRTPTCWHAKVQNAIALFSLADWIAFVRISGDNTMHVEITRPARTRVSRESPSLVSIQLFLGYRHVSFYAPQHTYLCAS
jgi:hypothetical protein